MSRLVRHDSLPLSHSADLGPVLLGLDKKNPHKVSLEVYKEHFETAFVAASEKYYKAESEALLADKTVAEYVSRAEERLREEEVRIERHLNSKTRKGVCSSSAILSCG